jgi:hypothetical protein
MSKVSTLARSGRELILAFILIAFAVLTTGCGSSDTASVPPPSGNDPPPPPPAAVIEGVATPTSVAVVTATNAQ